MPRLLKESAARPDDTPPRAPEYLEVLARGLRVLEAFRDRTRPLTLSDVASQVGLPRATVRRALLTLANLGFVTNEGRLFSLTPRVLSLASAYLTSNNVPLVMQPVVENVSRQVGEACSAAILDGDDVVFVARSNPQRIVSVGLEIGYRLPACGTAVGRAMLSGLPKLEADTRVKHAKLSPFTHRTIVGAKQLEASIEAARQQGFATADQEVEEGFRSIAVPVFRADGRVACALHIGTHSVSKPLAESIERFVPVLQAAAAAAKPMLV